MFPGPSSRLTFISPNDVAARDATPQKSLTGLFPEHGLVAVIWVLTTVAIVITFLRCFVRFSENRRLFSDDYWIIIALVLLVATAVLQTLLTPDIYFIIQLGAGILHLDQTDVARMTRYRALAWSEIVIFLSQLWCVKASFLSLFYRLFTQLPGHRRFWWVVAVFTGLAYIGCWMTTIFVCHPPSSFFHFRKSRVYPEIDVYGES